jgi:hypothetical protein
LGRAGLATCSASPRPSPTFFEVYECWPDQEPVRVQTVPLNRPSWRTTRLGTSTGLVPKSADMELNPDLIVNRANGPQPT